MKPKKASAGQLAKLNERIAIIEDLVENAESEFPGLFQKDLTLLSKNDCQELIQVTDDIISLVKRDRSIMVSEMEIQLIESMRLIRYGDLHRLVKCMQSLIAEKSGG